MDLLNHLALPCPLFQTHHSHAPRMCMEDCINLPALPGHWLGANLKSVWEKWETLRFLKRRILRGVADV
eukprot:3638633-Rhodomonas_salina.2